MAKENNRAARKDRYQCARAFRRSILCWLGESFGNPDNLPSFLAALFTLLLAIFAYYAWSEATRSTRALQDQLDVLRAEQRAWIAPKGFIQTPANFIAKIDQYTEAGVRFENVGKEPALKLNEQIYPVALPMSSWNHPSLMLEAIRKKTGYDKCDSIPLNPNGRTVWPGAKPAQIVGFSKEETAKINARTHYAMLAGCVIYETLHTRHQTEVCVILEPVIQGGGWRSVNCVVYNQGT
jgi:hypothetical protein